MKNLFYVLFFSGAVAAGTPDDDRNVVSGENTIYEKQLVCELLNDLKLCLDDSRDNDVHLPSYIIIWTHLKSVLDAMGSVFKFVSSDVNDKIKILQNKEKEQNFITVEKMMIKEKSTGKINYDHLDEKSPSASRTLLVLHRAFKMISLLFGKLSRNENDGMISTIAYESYHSSPMPAHHSWFIRKSIDLAVYTLPDRQSFCKKIGPKLTDEELMEILKEVEGFLEEIFSRIELLYIKHELENIP
ncbi:unnamed protein product [Oikopleura dioica]|uniref:Glycolipid transfer protein domain-containing protein n=1 Tax=Oikopleura dioica TaxID=34765 RepID=E4XKF5_OIKDI|nr:unnamed protein product [Oikopleura dioica]